MFGFASLKSQSRSFRFKLEALGRQACNLAFPEARQVTDQIDSCSLLPTVALNLLIAGASCLHNIRQILLPVNPLPLLEPMYCQSNEPDRAINTADKTVELHDLGQRYPVPHRDALAASARQWSLDEAMVYSIIRQESRFMPEARSRVGATGLMQLMPATAKWVARQIPVQNYRPEMLVQPEVNIHMGTYYFHRVLAELGHPLLATAAYNAGPGRARRWRDERALEGAIYAETIPFNETRDYVKKVFANAWFYRHRLTGKTASLRAMLGSVPGRAGDASASVASILP